MKKSLSELVENADEIDHELRVGVAAMLKVGIRPLRDLLIVRADKTPGMVGLIHLPDMGSSGNKSSCTCTVVAAGPKVQLAHVGSKVLVESYGSHPAGDEVVCDGETFTMIRERDLVGVLC